MARSPAKLLILAVLFSAAQLSLAAHNGLHTTPDPIQCPLCTGHAQPNSALIASTIVLPAVEPVVQKPVTAVVFPARSFSFQAYRSRAPPRSF